MKYKSYLAPVVLSLFTLLVVTCPSAQATYIATLNEVGIDVVGTGSGSLDVTDLTPLSDANDAAFIFPSVAALLLGPTSNGAIDRYGGVSGPTTFGSGGQVDADTGSGNFAGIVGGTGFSLIGVPNNYVSGSALGTTIDTWNNQTFATLGVTPGTYVWNWGTGIHADSFTLQIGPVGPTNGVPETGSTIALMLGAVGTLVAFRQKLEVRKSPWAKQVASRFKERSLS